jgi:hypothetical protein
MALLIFSGSSFHHFNLNSPTPFAGFMTFGGPTLQKALIVIDTAGEFPPSTLLDGHHF